MVGLGTLAPGLLIAPPPLTDPNFDRTVVMLAVHNDGGALGFVVNRAAPITLGDLLGYAGYGEAHKGNRSAVLYGGPVQPSSGWIIAADPEMDVADGVIGVDERIRVTSSRAAFDHLVKELDAGAPAARRLVLLGYSGWAPGQLEGEIAAGAWLPVPLYEDIVFDPDLDGKWDKAYAKLGLTPGSVINMRGGGEA
jgi:putative transcriptional regulator